MAPHLPQNAPWHDLHCCTLQVRIQLKRFSEAAKRIREAVGSESGLPAAPAMAKKAKKGQLTDADLSDLLDTELKPGLDTSFLGEQSWLHLACLVNCLQPGRGGPQTQALLFNVEV